MKRKILDGEFLGRLESASLNIKNPLNGYYGGNHKVPSYGNTIEFADYREYVPGDDPRRIDWNLYGRFEKFFIKMYVDERQVHTQIFLDCSASMSCGRPEKATTAMQIAAAFGFLSVKAMDRVSIKLLHEEKCSDLCGIIRGKESFYNAMEAFENIDYGGNADLENSILSCPDPGYSDGLSIIISDFFTESNWKNAVDYLLYKHRDVLLVQILSPEEISPGTNGRIQMVDTETLEIQDSRNMKMDITKSSVDAYHKALEDYYEEIRLFCASRNADYIRVSSSDAIEKILFEKG